MINLYYGYSILWGIVLLFYSFGFSNLCKPLDNGLLFFLIFSILVSLVMGFVQRKKFKYIHLDENPHKSKRTTMIFLFLFFIEIIIERKVPLLNVLLGQSYNSSSYSGLKGLHMIMSSSAIIYSFYLSYLYSNFKCKKLLYENILIVLYFCLLVQRQNILICLLGFIFYSFFSSFKKKKINLKKVFAIIVSLLMLLYGFGVMGNFRYGSSWKWNDTTMIENLGQINEKYPSIVPKQYFWSYLYVVSPLVNLNTNIEYYRNEKSDLKKYVFEFTPEFLQNILNYEKENVYLPVTSLTASTAYVRGYKYLGYFGMYMLFLAYMFLTNIILNICYRKNRPFFMVNCMSLAYFLLFTFFENTMTYSTTSMIVIISFILSFKYTLKN